MVSLQNICYVLLYNHVYKINVYSLRVERVTASGGEVGRLNFAGGAEVCSLRSSLAVEFIFGQTVSLLGQAIAFKI